MANIGTTIAPWMLFFQQARWSTRASRRRTSPGASSIRWSARSSPWSWRSSSSSSPARCSTAQDIDDAAQAAKLLMTTHHYVGDLHGDRPVRRRLLGAICISLASSWAFGEIFGWAHSLNNKIKEAPWFYVSYFFTLVTAGLVVLIPGAPLVLITLFVQVVAVTLLPAALVFLILLLNDKEDHGRLRQHAAGRTSSTARSSPRSSCCRRSTASARCSRRCSAEEDAMRVGQLLGIGRRQSTSSWSARSTGATPSRDLPCRRRCAGRCSACASTCCCWWRCSATSSSPS